MENIEIAEALGRVADLLEIQDANPFRVRAYRNAVRTIASHAVPLRKRVSEGADLTELPAIGKEMAGHIEELVKTGKLGVLDELSRDVPASLIELMRLPGVGPKKARKLWRELGIETIEALEAEARAGRVAALGGFGEKTQSRILEAIETYRKHTGRLLLVEAEQLLVPLLEHMRETALERLEVAGSYRRRCETIGDIDLLAVSGEPARTMEWFKSYPAVARVLVSGETKTSIVLRSGLQVDLRVVPLESFGAAFIYFTGSKEHGIRLRQRALDRGLSLSEYALSRLPPPGDEPGQAVAGDTEDAVYAALDLPWIPPELREDRGEIEAAERGELPELIRLEDLRGDLQMHSTWSDGRNTIEEMLEACARRGYEYFALTDHSKALAMTGGLDADKLRRQWEEIERIAARHPEIRLLRSMEVDILQDGSLDLEDELLEALDVVVVSVHSHFRLPAEQQTERILAAIRHPEVNILAHPTGRLINRREPMAYDLDAVLRVAAECGVAVELNAQPTRLDLRDTQLMRARELGVKVVISTDAHRARELDLMHWGVEQARRAWLTSGDVLNALPLQDLLAALGRRRGR